MDQQPAQPDAARKIDLLILSDPRKGIEHWLRSPHSGGILGRLHRAFPEFDPEDIFAEALLRALRCIGEYNPEKRPFRWWFIKIAINTAHDMRRSRAWRGHPVLDQEVAAQQPEQDAAQRRRRNERAKKLRQLIQELPKEQRNVIMLNLEGAPTAEIARRLGKTETNVRVTKRNAIAALHKLARQHGI